MLTKQANKNSGWATASRSGTMERCMKGSGLKTKHLVEVLFGMLKETYMLVSFSKTKPTVLESILMSTEADTQVSG